MTQELRDGMVDLSDDTTILFDHRSQGPLPSFRSTPIHYELNPNPALRMALNGQAPGATVRELAMVVVMSKLK
ncbi:hypothetical protein N7495_006628 [Penicillium taxi]|uniref:uncharacterized protein n=1 Tax=Penicillium taxi TaxID=168475 RepID=UPI002544D648|nr:uncharacterized protein N7495_006628 [Penicillium taxi]KAJ5894937.1 hypothetical protein N7495_006628 [Penicillium taxi]